MSTATPIFFPQTKSACSPSAVNESYKTYYRTPVPLRVRFRSHVCGGFARMFKNHSFSQLKKHRNLEVNFHEVPVPAVPLTVDVLESPRISRCVKNAIKRNVFCMLFLCSTERAADEIENS